MLCMIFIEVIGPNKRITLYENIYMKKNLIVYLKFCCQFKG